MCQQMYKVRNIFTLCEVSLSKVNKLGEICRRSHFNVLSEEVTPVSNTNDEVSNGDFASANRVKFNNKRLKTAQTVFVEN